LAAVPAAILAWWETAADQVAEVAARQEATRH
jgi:hypothetical protein